MSDHSCQSTGQSDPGEAGTGGERSNSGPRGWQMQMGEEKKGNKTLLQRWQRCTRRQIIVNSNLQNSASHSDRLTIMEPLKAR